MTAATDSPELAPEHREHREETGLQIPVTLYRKTELASIAEDWIGEQLEIGGCDCRRCHQRRRMACLWGD